MNNSVEFRKEKAKKLRMTRPIVHDLNLDKIKEDLWDMQNECEEVRWYYETDEDTLLNALDGDEDEAYEFRMAFADLCAECDRMIEDLHDAFLPDNFDTLLVGIGAGEYGGGYFGWDSYEQDYYGLDVSDDYLKGKAAEKIKRYTKDQIIEFYTITLKVIYSYLGLKYRYDSLKSAMDIIKEQNTGVLNIVKEIDRLYDKAEEESHGFMWWSRKESYMELEKLFEALPQEAWLQ